MERSKAYHHEPPIRHPYSCNSPTLAFEDTCLTSYYSYGLPHKKYTSGLASENPSQTSDSRFTSSNLSLGHAPSLNALHRRLFAHSRPRPSRRPSHSPCPAAQGSGHILRPQVSGHRINRGGYKMDTRFLSWDKDRLWSRGQAPWPRAVSTLLTSGPSTVWSSDTLSSSRPLSPLQTASHLGLSGRHCSYKAPTGPAP